MRSNIKAKSHESVPPAPALISRKQLLVSLSLQNRHSTSKTAHLSAKRTRFFSVSPSNCKSFSDFASSAYSILFFKLPVIEKNTASFSSRTAFSLKTFCASKLLCQRSGSADLRCN
jgi:hypothetical protein